LVLGLIIIGLSESYLTSLFENNILFSRLQRLGQDGGSGRISIYEEIFNSLESSSFFQLLFGHGYNSVIKITTEEVTAHNDFLEILYNYGIFAFFIYLLIHYQLLKKTIYCLKKRNTYAFSMTYTYVIFIILSSISHIIIYQYFLILIPYIALVFAKTEEEQVEESEIPEIQTDNS